jgi:heat shock protein HslJ
MRAWTKACAAVLFSVVFAAALTGCTAADTPQAGSLPAGSTLEGTKWKLVGWTIDSVDPATVTITATFAGGQISGNSGVNSYSGPCTLGPGGAFSVGPLAATQMAGPEPAMHAEAVYLTLLGQAASYTVADGTLTLRDKGGNESLIFEPR